MVPMTSPPLLVKGDGLHRLLAARATEQLCKSAIERLIDPFPGGTPPKKQHAPTPHIQERSPTAKYLRGYSRSVFSNQSAPWWPLLLLGKPLSYRPQIHNLKRELVLLPHVDPAGPTSSRRQAPIPRTKPTTLSVNSKGI
jgi:hypothetical protein